jgi:hypothetical protein
MTRARPCCGSPDAAVAKFVPQRRVAGNDAAGVSRDVRVAAISPGTGGVKRWNEPSALPTSVLVSLGA